MDNQKERSEVALFFLSYSSEEELFVMKGMRTGFEEEVTELHWR